MSISGCEGIGIDPERKTKILEDPIYEHPVSQILISLFRRPIPDDPVYHDRLKIELKLVIDCNFIRLFTQVREILDLIDPDIPHIIRGSSGSSLICYLMDITDIDPVFYHISLARFMNEKRTDYPDIDIDFPWNIRDSIFKIVHDRWKNKVGRVSNHLYYQEASALRQAIREKGYSKFIPAEFNLDDIFPLSNDRETIYTRMRELVGSFKGYSLHCGGIVIFDEPIPENLILKEYSIFRNKIQQKSSELSKARTTVLTYFDGKVTEINKSDSGENGLQLTLNKSDIEKGGMIKIDILSNRGLGQLWDIDQTPLSIYCYRDQDTYDLLASGDVIGITYSESRAMTKILVDMKPSKLDHIAEALALVRPSASQSFQKSDYLRNFQLILRDEVSRQKYLIYDDDAIEYIQKLLNVHESIADTYRKAFAKNNKEKKDQFLIDLLKAHPELTPEEAIMTHDQLNRLNCYSFCKSHAYSYARLVWALAYQKVHNTISFWIATLNNCQSSYRRWVHFREAACVGIKITYGRGPWKIDNVHGNKTLLPIDNYQYEQDISPQEGMLRWKYWTGPNFYPGMFYRKYPLQSLSEIDFNILSDRTSDSKKKQLHYFRNYSAIPAIITTVCYFKGIIACSRYHRSDRKDENGRLHKREGNLITFCTIGYDNHKFLDLIVDGIVELRYEHFLEGAGIVKPGISPDSLVCIDVLWYKTSKIPTNIMLEDSHEISSNNKPKPAPKKSTYNWDIFLTTS